MLRINNGVLVVPPFECAWLTGEGYTLRAGAGCLSFEAKGDTDVTVILKSTPGAKRLQPLLRQAPGHAHHGGGNALQVEQNYTIIFGSHRNSCLKIEKNGVTQCMVAGVACSRVSNKAFSKYWVDLNHGILTVGHGEPGQGVCHQWRDTQEIPGIQHIGLSCWDRHVSYRSMALHPPLDFTRLQQAQPGGGASAVPSLFDATCAAIMAATTPANVCRTLHVAELLLPTTQKLYRYCLDYIARHLETVVQLSEPAPRSDWIGDERQQERERERGEQQQQQEGYHNHDHHQLHQLSAAAMCDLVCQNTFSVEEKGIFAAVRDWAASYVASCRDTPRFAFHESAAADGPWVGAGPDVAAGQEASAERRRSFSYALGSGVFTASAESQLSALPYLAQPGRASLDVSILMSCGAATSAATAPSLGPSAAPDRNSGDGSSSTAMPLMGSGGAAGTVAVAVAVEITTTPQLPCTRQQQQQPTSVNGHVACSSFGAAGWDSPGCGTNPVDGPNVDGPVNAAVTRLSSDSGSGSGQYVPWTASASTVHAPSEPGPGPSPGLGLGHVEETVCRVLSLIRFPLLPIETLQGCLEDPLLRWLPQVLELVHEALAVHYRETGAAVTTPGGLAVDPVGQNHALMYGSQHHHHHHHHHHGAAAVVAPQLGGAAGAANGSAGAGAASCNGAGGGGGGSVRGGGAGGPAPAAERRHTVSPVPAAAAAAAGSDSCWSVRFQRRCLIMARELEYVCDGDASGVLHFLGTQYGSQGWVNPMLAKRVDVRASSPTGRTTDPRVIVGRQFVRTNFAGPRYVNGTAMSWWLVDLGEQHQLAITYYSVRHDGSQDFARSWVLQGSRDLSTWVDLKRHAHDTTIKVPGQYASWPVIGPAAAVPYRAFRLLLTAPNASSNPASRYNFCLSNLELYGFLHNGAGAGAGNGGGAAAGAGAETAPVVSAGAGSGGSRAGAGAGTAPVVSAGAGSGGSRAGAGAGAGAGTAPVVSAGAGAGPGDSSGAGSAASAAGGAGRGSAPADAGPGASACSAGAGVGGNGPVRAQSGSSGAAMPSDGGASGDPSRGRLGGPSAAGAVVGAGSSADRCGEAALADAAARGA